MTPDIGRARSVPAGGAVFRQGDAPDGAYVVVSGTCRVVRDGEVIASLHEGQVFGEMGAFGDRARSADVVAATDVELRHLTVTQIRQALSTEPAFFIDAYLGLVARLRAVEDRELAHLEEQQALAGVQASLLPGLPIDRLTWRLDGLFSPASEASGDVYGVEHLPDGRVMTWLGDVMGHGAAAALTTAVAAAQVAELSRTVRRTDELLLRLDGYLRDNAPRRHGMSMVVLVLDPTTGLVECSSAGHTPPLLVRDGAATPVQLTGGMLLGMPFVGGRGYDRRELRLEPGDGLFAATDGLHEVRTTDGGTIGFDGLARMLVEALVGGVGEPLGRLAAAVADADASAAAEDDRTALLLSWRGAGD